MDEKNMLPREKKDTDVLSKLIELYGHVNYRKGVDDAIKGVRVGIGITMVGLLGAVVIATLLEERKKKHTEDFSE